MRCAMRAQHIRYGVLLTTWACSVGVGVAHTASAQDFASRSDQLQIEQRRVATKPSSSANSLTSLSAAGSELASEAKPARGPVVPKGPYYVDFRARTAATYGHAFVWYGKTREKAVEVAGLHPAGDEVPYILGHLMWVPSETGASYGDLDPEYLTANYRVYLNEADAKTVFAYIKKLQASSPVWNAESSNCTSFIGSIAEFMGL